MEDYIPYEGDDKMICKKCNAVLDDDSLFCDRCGAAVEKEPEVQIVIDTEKDSLLKYCGSCGREISKNAKFCPYCSRKTDVTYDNMLHQPLSNEKVMEKLDATINVIRKRNNLVDQLKNINAELNMYLPVLSRDDYLKKHPEKRSTVLHIFAFVFLGFFLLDVIIFALGGTLSIIAFLFSNIFLDFLPFLIGVIFAVIANVKDFSVYRDYKNNCEFNVNRIMPEYNEKYNELVQIEQMLDNPDLSVIPRSHWKNADLIYFLAKTGTFATIDEVIKKNRLIPER